MIQIHHALAGTHLTQVSEEKLWNRKPGRAAFELRGNFAEVGADHNLVKNLPAMQETWVRFLGQEDPLEEETATHSSILAWKIPWTEEPSGLQSIGLQESDTS